MKGHQLHSGLPSRKETNENEAAKRKNTTLFCYRQPANNTATMETSDAAISIRPLLQLHAIPMTSQALKGVLNPTHVLFKVVTGHEQEETTRPPINLAIVLDRSGSMMSKGKLSCAKEAIVKVIEGLTDRDVMSFVVYGSDVTTIFQNEHLTAESKQKLIAKVNAVQTRYRLFD